MAAESAIWIGTSVTVILSQLTQHSFTWNISTAGNWECRCPNGLRHYSTPPLTEGFVSTYGLAYWNSVDEDGKRFTKKVATLQLTCPKSEIYCQLIDVSETDAPEVPMIKILMIHNPKKANPYGLRRFVKNLRFILIEKRGYDFAWGCPLESR